MRRHRSTTPGLRASATDRTDQPRPIPSDPDRTPGTRTCGGPSRPLGPPRRTKREPPATATTTDQPSRRYLLRALPSFHTTRHPPKRPFTGPRPPAPPTPTRPRPTDTHQGPRLAPGPCARHQNPTSPQPPLDRHTPWGVSRGQHSSRSGTTRAPFSAGGSIEFRHAPRISRSRKSPGVAWFEDRESLPRLCPPEMHPHRPIGRHRNLTVDPRIDPRALVEFDDGDDRRARRTAHRVG